MNDDELAIRRLIEDWATAAHEGDLATVTAHHGAEIVMYDVPPPEDGVHGLAAYRETWPGLFQWQERATSDLLSLEVVAGQDVAFAYGFFVAGHPRSSRRYQTGVCASPWGCARLAISGQFFTSTTRSRLATSWL